MNYSNIEHCRLCSGQVETMISFGENTLANDYPVFSTQKQEKYPLTLVKCKKCGHVQLKETVKPEILFSNYFYSSSDSPSLVKHFKEFCDTVSEFLKLDKESNILEIGCNDGILLKHFNKKRFPKIYGVEPAVNLYKKAQESNAFIINDFFNKKTADLLSKIAGKFDLICSNNTFAHIADLDTVVSGIRELLKPDGVFVFENAYLLGTIQNLYFDQIYHEHLQYYGIAPLITYLGKFGLQIFKVEHNDIQGGSIRVYVKNLFSSKWEIDKSVEEFLNKEKDFKLYDNDTYKNFRSRLRYSQKEALAFVSIETKAGKTFSCYGCPAKFSLLSSAFNLNNKNIKYVVDDSPLKIGKYSSGAKIPIVSRQTFVENPTDYCIISAWNMVTSIIEKNQQYKGCFIKPLPEFKIL